VAGERVSWRCCEGEGEEEGQKHELVTFRRRGGAGNFKAMASVGGWLARKGQLLVAPGVVVGPSLQLLACG
jgi:hypothetical protein